MSSVTSTSSNANATLAGVRHLVREGDGSAGEFRRIVRIVRVNAVGELLDVDAGIDLVDRADLTLGISGKVYAEVVGERRVLTGGHDAQAFAGERETQVNPR